MRNELAYEAYMGFMLKSLFLIGSLFLLIITTMIIIDLIFILFAPRQKGSIIRADIAPVGIKNRLGNFHSVFIFYRYKYKGESYTCSHLNSFGRLIFNNYDKANETLLKCVTNNEVTVYICPFSPKLSIILPLKVSTAIKFSILFTIFAVLFAGDQTGVIDVFPNSINVLK